MMWRTGRWSLRNVVTGWRGPTVFCDLDGPQKPDLHPNGQETKFMPGQVGHVIQSVRLHTDLPTRAVCIFVNTIFPVCSGGVAWRCDE